MFLAVCVAHYCRNNSKDEEEEDLYDNDYDKEEYEDIEIILFELMTAKCDK